jgi:hypothetical protein
MASLSDRTVTLSTSPSHLVTPLTPRLDTKMVNAEVARLEKMFHELVTKSCEASMSAS